MKLTLEWDKSRLGGLPKADKAVLRAVKMAGRDALRVMRTQSARGVTSRKRIKYGAALKFLTAQNPKGPQSLGSLAWRLVVSGKNVPVSDYPHRQVRKGISAAINKGKRTLIQSAFIATTKSGHTGVFKRKGDARKPIVKVLTSRVVDVFKDSDFTPWAFAAAQMTFRETFDRVLPLELDKLK